MPQRIDWLRWGDLQLAQEEQAFRLSLDGVLLADFATIKQQDNVGDLGTGNGALPLLLSCRAPAAQFTGLELLPEMAALAKQNVAANGLTEQIRIVEGDLRQATQLLGKGGYQLVVANPPFFVAGQGRVSKNPAKAAARTELYCTLADVVREGAGLLNSGGRLALIHKPERLAELCVLCQQYGIALKRLRLVQPMQGQAPNLMLAEGVRNGNPGLCVEAPLIVYKQKAVYSTELLEIFAGRHCRKG